MRIRFVAVALIGVSIATTSLAQKAMSKEEWQKGYNQAAQAFEKKDIKAITAFMSPDIKMSMGGKTMGLAESKKNISQWFAMTKELHCKMTVMSVTHKGAMATVVSNFNNWALTQPDPKTKKSSKMVDTGTDTAVWMWTKGKWLMKSMVTTNQKSTMDGKPIKM